MRELVFFKLLKYVDILSELFRGLYVNIYRCNYLMIGIGFKINPWEWEIDVMYKIELVKS